MLKRYMRFVRNTAFALDPFHCLLRGICYPFRRKDLHNPPPQSYNPTNGYSKGARYNTGDGIKMAIEVGANLWHLSTLSGPDVNFVNPETGISMGYSLSTTAPKPWATGFLAYDVIFVGGDGTRFVNESVFPDHGHLDVGGTPFSMQIPEDAYCVFDEDARLNGKAYYSWSDGMVEEIEKGWILKGETIEELAGKMGLDEDSLAATIQKYNSYCVTGEDLDFHRSVDFLKPLDNGPFYAFPVHPTMTNTQGGAERNENCKVVTPYGEPIPHLYSAGEFGSFWADIYQGGGNLGECLFTGRIAARNAVSVKSDVPECTVMEGKTAVDFSSQEETFDVGENEYVGSATGIGGELKLKVTVVESKIEAIETLVFNETTGLGDVAAEKVISAIIDANSTEVDGMAGATMTSNAVKAAVEGALAQAKK
jgi:uncharacterized protein with FMN-binding domain